MTTPLVPPGTRCSEKAGFLFSHRCTRDAIAQCSSCEKLICKKHVARRGREATCVTCGKKAHTRRGDQQHREYERNPYFYTSYYYDHYGYYGHGSWAHSHYGDDWMSSHDFSEADGASLHSDADYDDAFEHDMGAS